MEWGIMSPCGDFSRIPSPVPLIFEDPSVYSIQGSLYPRILGLIQLLDLQFCFFL
uniref:Uncharacterized protein n=1 Tax=Helianthus annuus TaxID=4232 RepID=A0A251VJW4_HELAN